MLHLCGTSQQHISLLVPISQSSLLSIVDLPKRDSELHHKHTFCNPFLSPFNKQKKRLLELLKSGYRLFLLHKTNPQILTTISASILEGDETEVLAHSNDVFSSRVGFSYGNTIFENTGMAVGAVTKRFVFPWYQPTWGGGSFKIWPLNYYEPGSNKVKLPKVGSNASVPASTRTGPNTRNGIQTGQGRQPSGMIPN